MDNDGEQSHLARLASNFLEFRRSNFLYDTILCVGDREFRVHGLLLASASTFFESILKDYDKPELRYIRLPMLDPNVMAIILDYIYTGKLILPFDEARQEFDFPPNLVETFSQLGIDLLQANQEIITYKREEDFSLPAPSTKVEPDFNAVFEIKPELMHESSYLSEIPIEQSLPEEFMHKPFPKFEIVRADHLVEDVTTMTSTIIGGECGLEFPSPREQEGHARQTQPIQKAYLCTDCGEQFTTELNLVRHIKVTHKEHLEDTSNLLTCANCEKQFETMLALKQHDCIRAKKKAYFCGECNRGFPFPSQLSSHMKSHSGERPYQCSQCSKSFSASLNLKQHERTHTGERPFGCHACDKKFTQRSHLLTHVRTHTGEKPFKCHMCPKAYKNRLDLRIHCEKKHKIDIRLREANHPNSFNRGQRMWN